MNYQKDTQCIYHQSHNSFAYAILKIIQIGIYPNGGPSRDMFI
jgi:hypothetical protein